MSAANTPVPSLVSLLICDQIIDDRMTNKKSAIGLFNAILVSRFPATIAQMVVMASLTEIQRRVGTELRLVRDSDNHTMFNAPQVVESPSPLATVDLVFALQGVQVPEPGQYAIELYGEGELLGRRRFMVYERGQQQPGAAPPEVGPAE